jgi:NO-binding membrane sensor protein with MHYT domain
MPMADRLAETKAWVLVGLIFTGSLILAIVVPGVALWAVSQMGRGKTESFYLGMMGCPLAVVAWAGVLGRMNLAYKRITGRRDDDVLGTSLAVAVLTAIVLFVVLIVLLGGHDPMSAGPWSY